MGNTQERNSWSIELCETRAHWAYLHHLAFGRPVYHTFLRLMDTHQDVVQEIHAGAALRIDDRRAERISTSNFLKASAKSLLLNGQLPAFALLARVHDGYYRSVEHTHTIMEATEDQTLAKWEEALEATTEFNRAGHIYDARTLNCNSFTHSLTLLVAGKVPERLTYAPGFENPISLTSSWLQNYNGPNTGHRVEELRTRVSKRSAEANAPFNPQPA
jgi:hypothetical protein